MIRKHYVAILVVIFFCFGACASEPEEEPTELEPIYFSTWDPTATASPTSTPFPSPTYTPTSVPIPTETPSPSPVPTSTSTPIPIAGPVTATPLPRSTASLSGKPTHKSSEIGLLLGKVRDAMSGAQAYSYVLSGEAILDAGGMPVRVPLNTVGGVDAPRAYSIFETSLMGMKIAIDSVQDGPDFFMKDSLSSTWGKSAGPPVGLIASSFWQSEGAAILNLPYDDQIRRKGDNDTGEYILSLADGSEGWTLLGLLGAGNSPMPFTLKDLELQLQIAPLTYEVVGMDAIFSIQEGGRFASEILGLPGLAGLGSTSIDLSIEFYDFGKGLLIDFPVIP